MLVKTLTNHCANVKKIKYPMKFKYYTLKKKKKHLETLNYCCITLLFCILVFLYKYC